MSTSLKVKCIPLFFLVTVSTLIHHFRNKKGAVGNSGQQKKSDFQESSVKFKSQGKWLQNCLEVVRLFSNLGYYMGMKITHLGNVRRSHIIKLVLTLTTILIAFFVLFFSPLPKWLQPEVLKPHLHEYLRNGAWAMELHVS